MKISSAYFKKDYDISKADLVGEGNFAQVFKVFDNQLNKFLAIRKVLKSEAQFQDLNKQRNINQELMKVKNQNILEIYDIIDSKQFVWYITEYCQGGSLWDSLNRLKDNKMKEKDAMNIILQVSKGVQELHNHRITHRDLKPQNILLKTKYVAGKPVPLVKLADFGLSTKKIIMETIAGTKEYIAPQQAKFQNYTNAVDVWSLGIICDEILHGTPFFVGQNNKEVFNKILKMPYKVRDQSIRDSIKSFLQSLLKKKPYERPIIAVIRKNIENILQQISNEQVQKQSDNQSSKIKTPIYSLHQNKSKPNPESVQRTQMSNKNNVKTKGDLKQKTKIQMIRSQGNIDQEKSILSSDKKTTSSQNNKQDIKPHYFKQTAASKSKQKLVHHNFGHSDQKGNFGLFKVNTMASTDYNRKQRESSIENIVVGSRYERLQNKFGGNLGMSYLPKNKNDTEISRSNSKEGIQFKHQKNDDNRIIKTISPKERAKQDDNLSNKIEKKKRIQRQGDLGNQSMQCQSQRLYQSNLEDPRSSTTISKNDSHIRSSGYQRAVNELKRSNAPGSGLDKYVKFQRKRRNSNGLKSQQKRQIISIEDYVKNVQAFKSHLQDKKITTPLRDKYSFMPSAYLSNLDLSNQKNLTESLSQLSKSVSNLENRESSENQVLFYEGEKKLRSKVNQCKKQFSQYKKNIKQAFFQQIDNQLESYLQKLLK